MSEKRPYMDDDLLSLDLSVSGVVTVEPERTFWDKVVIVHGLRRWFEKRGVLRGGGQRVTRHCYDLYRLLKTETGHAAVADLELGEDCVAHARMFFNSLDLDLASAAPGTFALGPTPEMMEPLAKDYQAMSGMVFDEVPPFSEVIVAVAGLEAQLNGRGTPADSNSQAREADGHP